MTRIDDKMDEIRKFLSELESFLPKSFEAYSSSIEKKAACERYFEKIVEALTDIAFLIIKHKKLGMPIDDADAFTILSDKKVIEIPLAKKLKEAKGMRNIITHAYCKVDDSLVFESLQAELEQDAEAFLTVIEKQMK